jgi:hypothetical protein
MRRPSVGSRRNRADETRVVRIPKFDQSDGGKLLRKFKIASAVAPGASICGG